MKLTDRRIADLVREATTSNKAWNELVLAFTSQVKWAIRSHDLTALEQEEAARATWASLAEHLGELRDAGEVAQWLTTRTHTACLQVKRVSALGRSNLTGSDLTGSDLHGSDLHGSDLHGSDLHGSDLTVGPRAVHGPATARRRGPDRRHGPRTGPDRRHGPRVGADRHDHHGVLPGGDSPDTLAARLTRREVSPGQRELPEPV